MSGPRRPLRVSGPGRARLLSLTTASLLALGAALLAGLAGRATGDPRFAAAAAAVRPIADLWLAALQATVVPLVIVCSIRAVVGARREERVARLAGRAVLLFLAMLAAAGLATLLLAPALVSLYPVSAGTRDALSAGIAIPPAVRQTAATNASAAGWLSSLLPRNLLEAALRGEVLPLLLFAALFGLAVASLPAEKREPLARLFEGLAEAMLVLVGWILVLTPFGVFAFTFSFALSVGRDAVGLLGAYVAVVCGLLLLYTAVLYPISAFFGRVGIARFAGGVAPAQLVAVGTRSSIASLPALIEGGRDRLRLPETATGVVLPLSVSVFKLNRTVSSTAKLVFLAHVYAIPLPPATLATFLATVIVLSFGTLGLPGGGSGFKTLPAYLAAGIPLEALVIAEAVDTIPDIFKTLLNVTADMSAATLLSRSSRAESPERSAVEERSRSAGTA